MFPAHAGMNRIPFALENKAIDVPRTRGDEPSAKCQAFAEYKCSPHTRG